jgi:excisionase family DNA binding protein
MGTNALKPVFSIAEFCDATSLGRTRVYEEIKIGRLKAVRVGRRTLISNEEMHAWLLRLATGGETE